jgi:hypothetical protein
MGGKAGEQKLILRVYFFIRSEFPESNGDVGRVSEAKR